ncbi:MAG: Glutamine--fructose-6-phosphate transaminase (isomerizing) [Nocardia sp.]|uniref:GNAT family N-acetyltransferase n=1 Tax=Nocardia sp. TaxID=1821 RepID=UPI0026070A76|nr:GNAT family protein [Nocardia sp.]MCU1643252.1 Glutamine--fructose-6-phosphate transaminase (isomerizing) [Nocardia sp.]
MPVPLSLNGRLVRLEPLAPHHASGISEAAAGDRDDFAFTPVPHSVDEALEYVAQALSGHAAGTSLAFAIIAVASGRILGSTRFTRFDYWQGPMVWPPLHGAPPGDALMAVPDAAEIGNTWLSPEARGTGINLESKMLLLQHAFETWQVRRITFRADVRNHRSRLAIERLGATSDGVRRAHSRGLDGEVRSTAFYSILEDEWATVRATIEGQFGGQPAPNRLIDA